MNSINSLRTAQQVLSEFAIGTACSDNVATMTSHKQTKFRNITKKFYITITDTNTRVYTKSTSAKV